MKLSGRRESQSCRNGLTRYLTRRRNWKPNSKKSAPADRNSKPSWNGSQSRTTRCSAGSEGPLSPVPRVAGASLHCDSRRESASYNRY